MARLPELVVAEDTGAGPEEDAVLADSVGLALMVVLETLRPAERLAFVLHDMFAMPFDEIGSSRRNVDRRGQDARLAGSSQGAGTPPAQPRSASNSARSSTGRDDGSNTSGKSGLGPSGQMQNRL
jgi:RNA polymerase sigma-70 factor (ECF subfamily)